jgi:Xaa-Pro dipeptidase
VQFAKATWGPEGRKKHYIAVHHLVELRKEALAYIAKQLAAGAAVTEREVQVRLEKGMTTRGLVGPAPVVAFGKNSADPDYVPAVGRAATLAPGDVVLVSLAGKVEGGMFAAHSWVAVADSTVGARLQVAFETAALARDEALALVSDRIKRRRAVKGWEVDKAARDFLTKAGVIDRVLHRTGHSLDGDLYGSGTDLDDLEVKDQRNLVVGTGFTIGPGLYYAGELGVRPEVSVYLGKDGLEVTTPVQDYVELLIKK